MTLQSHSWACIQEKQTNKQNMIWKDTCTPVFTTAVYNSQDMEAT